MSGYIKLIIFIVVLLSVSAAIILIDSSMDNINNSMPSISKAIVQGDNDYNDSVKLLNEKNFDEANQKAESAGDNYNDSFKKLSDLREQYNKDLHEVHKNYIDKTLNELKLKMDAVDELKESIYYLKIYYNYTGSSHGIEANDLMSEAVEYQNERNNIVLENSEVFT